MIMKILTFPDPKLREVSKPVTEFGPELKKLSEDMIETMYDANGIGLAAPQVGELVRMVVIDTRPKDDKGRRYKYEDMTDLEKAVPQPLILINPEIVKGEGKTTFDEGCLSIPGYYETVERYNYIEMKAFDLNGKEFIVKTDGLLAICMQHELDHLEGTLFVDHLSFVKGNKIKNQIKKYGYPVKDKDKAADAGSAGADAKAGAGPGKEKLEV
ncbi:peptide deformylase [Bdellovibrio bacteriovorus]|uniref:Peptide deformylase n=1 Tax=Bdellovibrio bacteriovorus TaxID=959 RepID=A0A150WFG7_BDEBC|nr:peptide deformylase [Bdellovibrio bacteriovorus]KYG61789.1 peptide deformylase [Bdellovibrio bacteriovorus]